MSRLLIERMGGLKMSVSATTRPMRPGEVNGKDYSFVDKATWVAVNDYEGQLLQERTGLDAGQIASRVEAYIVTKGAEGSVIHADNREYRIPSAPAESIKDPTGCGDAYRAGLIYGLMRDMDLSTCGRMASLMGALKVEHPGTQNQRFTYPEFAEQFRQQFGYAL